MTTAIVLLVVVIINYYLPKIPVVKDFIQANGSRWVKIYLEFLLNFFSNVTMLRGSVAALLIILPVLLAAILLNHLVFILGQDLLILVFMSVILLYCLNSNSEIEDEHDSILVLAHERMFGIMFWFVIFGAPGAIFYWFLTISKAINNKLVNDAVDLSRGLNIIHGIAAWLPSRITGLIYALVGDFVQAFGCWYACMRTATTTSSQVLLECGQAALHASSKQDEEELVVRATVAWVILGMLLALVLHKGN